MRYVGHGVYPFQCWNLEANSSPNLYITGKAGVMVIGDIITHVLTTSPEKKGHMFKKNPQTKHVLRERWKTNVERWGNLGQVASMKL